MIKTLALFLAVSAAACTTPDPTPAQGVTEFAIVTEYTINGVHFSLAGTSAAVPDGTTAWDGTILDPIAWADLQILVGAEVPDVGTVVNLGLKRKNVVPAGQAFKLIIGS